MRSFASHGRIAVAMAIALAAVVAGTGPARADSAATTVDMARLQILRETNDLRSQNGLANLVESPALDAVAQNWSTQQAAAGAMSHNPSMSVQIPSGWVRAGENVAYGYSYILVTTAWKNSPGHLANLLGDYTDIGIGYSVGSNGYPYYTQVFGKYPSTLRTMLSSFVTSCYRDVLGRAPSAGEVNWWVDQLNSGASWISVANGFNTSDEYRLQRIGEAYHDVLGRTPDPTGLNFWLGSMRAGSVQSDDPHRLFLSSDEFFARSGGTEASWISALYRDILNRDVDPSGMSGWLDVLHARGRSAVVDGIWFSDEMFQQRVMTMYSSLLDRVATSSERDYWVAAARRQGLTVTRAAIMSSMEYFNRSFAN